MLKHSSHHHDGNNYSKLAIFCIIAILTSTTNAANNAAEMEEEFLRESQASKDAQIKPQLAYKKWQQARFKNLKKQQQTTTSQPSSQAPAKPPVLRFPDPPKPNSSAHNFLTLPAWAWLNAALDSVIPKAQAANVYGDITIDGLSNDWTTNERINVYTDRPASLPVSAEIFGRYVGGANPVYIFALKTPNTPIGGNTTVYLNTDQNVATGVASMGGADFGINIFTGDLAPHLYNKDLQWQGALEYAFSADKRFLEIVVPANKLTTLSASKAIDVLADINDQNFATDIYNTNDQFELAAKTISFPVRTDFSKRVGIVFSNSSKKNFFSATAYSDLFMELQHQAMMAGISFDLLNETDLTNLATLAKYDALIFDYAPNIPANIAANVHSTLYQAIYHYGVGIIAADHWLKADESNNSLPGDSYLSMKQLLGITPVSSAGPVKLDVTVGDVTHPAIKNYAANETIISYPSAYTSYFQALPSQAFSILAHQTFNNAAGKVPAVIATTTGGRNVHFASASLMGDKALVWQALQWVVFGNNVPVALKMGRQNSLFISRNDMDASKYASAQPYTDIPLLEILKNWKNKYNFVGSYYINIGNNPALGEYTDGSVALPLYKGYLALDNEIGTHSWTHPFDTNKLTASQIEYEFNQSMNAIVDNLGPTWRNSKIRGGAVPGAPETVETSLTISKYLDYLSGGWTAIGAGYPNAYGFITPESTKVYFGPNMTFDFTMIEYGVLPTNQYGVITSSEAKDLIKMSSVQASAYWKNEIDRILLHASQPIIHWPWHDYAATISAVPNSTICQDLLLKGSKSCYSLAMLEETVAYAYSKQAEFVTAADMVQRINTFRQAKMSVNQQNSLLNINVTSNNVGKFSLQPNLPNGQIIQKVNNWYAYNDKQVLLDDDGGTFEILLGSSSDAVTHITALPMRARLISVSGDGNQIRFSFEGEGSSSITLSNAATNYNIVSDNGTVSKSGNNLVINFSSFGVHNVTIAP